MNLTTSRLLGGPASSRWPKRSCPLRPSTVSKSSRLACPARTETSVQDGPKYAPPNSKLGFHRIYVRNEADTSVASARRQIEPAGDLVALAYRRAGLPGALIAKAMETPAADVYWVDAAVSRAQGWDRNLNFNPVLLDLAEQECGREPLTGGANPGGRSQFIAWVDCADRVRMRSLHRSGLHR